MPQSLSDLDLGQLTVAQKLDLITQVWDSIPDSAEALPLLDCHRRELEKRLALADAASETGVPWEQARAQLRSKPP